MYLGDIVIEGNNNLELLSYSFKLLKNVQKSIKIINTSCSRIGSSGGIRYLYEGLKQFINIYQSYILHGGEILYMHTL